MLNLDPNNPEHVAFINEVHEKSSKLTTKWMENYWEMLKHTTTFRRPPKNYFESDVIAQGMKSTLGIISKNMIYRRKKVPSPFVAGAKDLRHDHTIINTGLGSAKEDPRLVRPDTDLTLDPPMRPIDPQLEQIIYMTPVEKYGRKRYLHERSKISPEDKYYFQECSGWGYGWRLRDSGLVQNREHARCSGVRRMLNNHSGAEPDPIYSISYLLPDHSAKCSHALH